MKKKLLALLTAAMMACSVFPFAACHNGEEGGENNNNNNNNTEPVIAEVDEVGENLTLTAQNEDYSVLSDGTGMSGNGGRIHTHSNVASSMYAVSGTAAEFTFDIGRREQLGRMYFWNYNDASNLNYGAKDVTVSYSEDGVSWEEADTVSLAQGNGEAKLSADDNYADFGGVTAQYVKVEVESNHGGSNTGLSEVRLFRFRPRVEVGGYAPATPINRLNVSGNWTKDAEDYNATNGSGMSDPTAFDATHGTDPADMIVDSANIIGFSFDLQGNYPISKIYIWNYNDPANLDYGVQDFRLQYSDNGGTWSTVTALGTLTLPKGTGEALSPYVIELEEPIRARYLQLEQYSNYGGEEIGLSEVRFEIGEGWYADDANDWTALLSNYNGWSGADGIYTVNLDGKDYDSDRDPADKSTFFVFSDSIISTVNPATDIRSGVYMPNNTSAILTGGVADSQNISFVYPENESGAANIRPNPVEPASTPGYNKYYWLGDTFVVGDKLYVFALKIDHVTGSAFSFAQVGVDLARYNIVNGTVDYDSLTIIKDENSILCDLNAAGGKYYFGGAVYENTEAAGVINPDGYYYIYGYQDTANSGRKLVVARVLPENIEKFDQWEFLSASGSWSKDTSNLKFLADDIAPEVSVSQITTGEYKGKYVFVNTHYTTGTTLKISISDSPYGVFTNKTTLFDHDTVNTIPGSGNNSYNAKAHPALSGPGELIVSYNVNGDDCFTYGDIYRPRFLRVAMVPDALED